MDELEHSTEWEATSRSPQIARMELLDAQGAIRAAEAITQSRVFDEVGSAEALLAACRDRAEHGERVSAILDAHALASAREAMRLIAQSRLGIVVHAVAGHGGEELGALVDVGWGVLCASGPEDSFDLALIARRAAEDSGVPFVVVHALGHVKPGAGRAVAMVALPEEKACREFVGVSRLRPRHDPAHPSLAPLGDRAFGERVPFALGSAFREYGTVAGRRHDFFDKIPLGEAPLMLVGLGPVGDALLSATAELNAHGYDVGAVHVTALRPFPGARLVKSLARALAITILEPADEPLAYGGLLARELKSAFTDAITWAPGFPGIGRIPKIFVGVTGVSFDVADLAAICDNMLADERGRRSFSFAEAEHALSRPAVSPGAPRGRPSLRWVLDDAGVAELALATTAATFATVLGLRAHGIVSETPGALPAPVTVDVFASRDAARGGMARRSPTLVIASERASLAADVVAPLGPGMTLGVLATAGDGAALLPDAARVVARERRVRIVPLGAGGAGLDASVAVAAACAGASVAAAARAQKTSLDATHVARAVAEYLAGRGVAHADVAGERARRAFETTHEALVAAESAASRDRNGDPSHLRS